MPEWLKDSFQTGEQISLDHLIGRAVVSLVFGLGVAAVYGLSRHSRSRENTTLPTTLVLLCVLISLVTLVIGNSVARAFGLVGALSIVRFRTVVEDTRDTAYVIFAVVVGMAVGAGYAMLALIGIPTVAIATLLMRIFGGCSMFGGEGMAEGSRAVLTVRIGVGLEPEAILYGHFAQNFARYRLTSISTARQGTAFELIYIVRLKKGITLISAVTELTRMEGVMGVEFREE